MMMVMMMMVKKTSWPCRCKMGTMLTRQQCNAEWPGQHKRMTETWHYRFKTTTMIRLKHSCPFAEELWELTEEEGEPTEEEGEPTEEEEEATEEEGEPTEEEGEAMEEEGEAMEEGREPSKYIRVAGNLHPVMASHSPLATENNQVRADPGE